MKRSLYRFISLAYCIVIFLGGCKRVTVEANNNPQGYADSQVVGSWKITSIKSDKAYDWDGNGVAETDVLGTFTQCSKDMLFTFEPDKTGVFKLNCSITKNGTWQIINTQHLLWQAEGGSAQQEQLAQMTSDTFNTIRKVQFVLNGPIYSVTTTWKRQ